MREKAASSLVPLAEEATSGTALSGGEPASESLVSSVGEECGDNQPGSGWGQCRAVLVVREECPGDKPSSFYKDICRG